MEEEQKYTIFMVKVKDTTDAVDRFTKFLEQVETASLFGHTDVFELVWDGDGTDDLELVHKETVI